MGVVVVIRGRHQKVHECFTKWPEFRFLCRQCSHGLSGAGGTIGTRPPRFFDLLVELLDSVRLIVRSMDAPRLGFTHFIGTWRRRRAVCWRGYRRPWCMANVRPAPSRCMLCQRRILKYVKSGKTKHENVERRISHGRRKGNIAAVSQTGVILLSQSFIKLTRSVETRKSRDRRANQKRSSPTRSGMCQIHSGNNLER